MRGLARGQADDPLDHLVEREAGGVDLDRVFGGAQGAVLAALVAGVPLALGGEHGLGILARLLGAAARPLLRARRSGRPSAARSGLTTVPMSRPSAT